MAHPDPAAPTPPAVPLQNALQCLKGLHKHKALEFHETGESTGVPGSILDMKDTTIKGGEETWPTHTPTTE